MKTVKWKILIPTCLVCLLPILAGVALWGTLPEEIAIHFDIHNTPDNFTSKGFAVFGLPIIMAIVQAFCCIMYDTNAKNHNVSKRTELMTKWTTPFITVILYALTLGYSLGVPLDIRRIASAIVGIMLIVTGACLHELDYVKNLNLTKEKARKINKFLGIETVILGLLFLVSAFFTSKATICCLLLLILYGVINIIYGIKIKS